MSDRTVTVVQDEEYELPVIDDIRQLAFTVTSNTSSDSFKKNAEDIKSYRGTDAVFKRRVANDIKKFQRGVDGAETKQIQDKQFVMGYDIFDVVEPPYNLEYLAKIYVSPAASAHYAAVNAKVANIVGLGYRLVETSKTKRTLERVQGNESRVSTMRRRLDVHRDELLDLLEEFNEEDSFTEILVKVWRDYEVTGNGYLEVGRKRDGSIGYVGHIPAQTIRIRKKRDGFVQMSGTQVEFFANFGHSEDRNPIGGGKPNEIIHLKKYSPTSGYYGVPDVVAALNAIAGNEFAARFNLDYFENKAIPRHVIILKGAKLGSNAEQSLLSFFETGLKGQNHRSLFIPLPSGDSDNPVDIKFEKIEAGTQDSSFNNYRKANLSDILMAHRVPITKISVAEGASLAVARDADKTFKEQVCAPEQRILEKKLNKIVKELTDAFELNLNEMTLTDADTQSKIDERRVKNGIDLANEIRARDGLPGIPGGNKRVDLNQKPTAGAEQRANRERDSQRSAGATDSAGESRSPKGEGRSDGTS